MLLIQIKGQIQIIYFSDFLNHCGIRCSFLIFINFSEIKHGPWWKRPSVFKWPVAMSEFNLMQILNRVSVNQTKSNPYILYSPILEKERPHKIISNKIKKKTSKWKGTTFYRGTDKGDTKTEESNDPRSDDPDRSIYDLKSWLNSYGPFKIYSDTELSNLILDWALLN